MRKIKFKKYVPPVIEDSILGIDFYVVGTGGYFGDFTEIGYLHFFTYDGENDMAVIEDLDGKVFKVPINIIKFEEPPKSKQPKLRLVSEKDKTVVFIDEHTEINPLKLGLQNYSSVRFVKIDDIKTSEEEIDGRKFTIGLNNM